MVNKIAGEKEAVHASIPEDIAPGDLHTETLEELIENQRKGPTSIATDPESGKPIYLLTGRYGPYLQVGEVTDEEPKPKRASVPREHKPNEVGEELALKILSLPRTLGVHSEDGKEVIANRGRFGPYIKHGDDTRSLKKDDDVYTVTLSRALELLSIPKTRSRRAPKLIRELGKTSGGKSVGLYDGRYGAYLKVGTKNVSLPEELRTPEKLEKLDLAAVKGVI